MSTTQEQLTASPTPTLIERAAGLSRGQVMRSIIGPALDEFLRPIYVSQFEPFEVIRLPKAGPLRETAPNFAEVTIDILHGRLSERIGEQSEAYEALDRLREAREEVFHHDFDPIDKTLKEGVESGVVVPLTVAAHIDSLERGVTTTSDEAPDIPFEPTQLAGILARGSFLKILQHLTKGTNGFLGMAATRPRLMFDRDRFFSFNDPTFRPLHYRDAYTLEDGQVTGLSSAFHLSAQAKRGLMRSGFHQQLKEILDNRQDTDSSSGCPVRHSFEDENGVPQEPLIATSAQFLVAAMAELS